MKSERFKLLIQYLCGQGSSSVEKFVAQRWNLSSGVSRWFQYFWLKKVERFVGVCVCFRVATVFEKCRSACLNTWGCLVSCIV